MKSTFGFLKKNLFFCVGSALLIAAVILRCIAVLRDSLSFGYFQGVCHDVSAVLLTISLSTLFLPLFLEKKNGKTGVSLTVFIRDKRTWLFALPFLIGTASFAFSLFLYEGESKTPLLLFRNAIGVFLLVFLFLFALSLSEKAGTLFVPAVMIGAVAFCLYPLYLYRESSPLNADEKMVEEFAFLALSLYLLLLARVELGRLQYRFFPAASLCVIFYSLYVSLPALLFATVMGDSLSENAATPLLLLTAAVYAIFNFVRTKDTSRPSKLTDGEEQPQSQNEAEANPQAEGKA